MKYQIVSWRRRHPEAKQPVVQQLFSSLIIAERARARLEEAFPTLCFGIEKAQFALGALIVTSGALEAIEDAGQTPAEFFSRHATSNQEAAVTEGHRILSAHKTRKGVKLLVVTEADQLTTTILLPDESKRL